MVPPVNIVEDDHQRVAAREDLEKRGPPSYPRRLRRHRRADQLGHPLGDQLAVLLAVESACEFARASSGELASSSPTRLLTASSSGQYVIPSP